MPSLADWNLQTVHVTQALLGSISPNYRMITMDHDGREWVFSFVLDHEDAEDREEIDDFALEWEILQGRPTPCRIVVLIETGVLAWPSPPTRVVYRRRETFSGE
jgi:hypothetical protein